ncbi:MAG TPA: hypothetical protein VMC82_03615 [Thermoplasmata archaeon]|nr:hypothetical protein [Thermoplasmata archaeon]
MNSDDADRRELGRLRRRILDLYDAITFLMLIGIGVLVVYCIRLGSLTSPGAQQSFGLAVALMFLMAAMIVHLVDRTYRVWPLGRRFRPTPPGPVTVQSQAKFLAALVVVIAVAACAYVIAGLLT